MFLKKTNKGFTLVELAVVLVIGGLIVAAATSMFRGQVEYSRAKLTEERIKVIREAIAGYALLNDSKLPCVASLTTPPSDANFGKAQSICDEDGDDVNADGDTVLGVFVGDGRDPDGTDPLTGYVRIGAVPVRTLGLSNEFITDGWDRRFVYAVTENQVNGGYDGKHGSITILDAAGHSATDPASNVVYAVVSMGPDGKGSYSLEGVRNGPDCGAVPGVDNENCDMADATFASTTLYSKAEDAAFFDDYIAYETVMLKLIGNDSGEDGGLEDLLNCQRQGQFYDPDTGNCQSVEIEASENCYPLEMQPPYPDEWRTGWCIRTGTVYPHDVHLDEHCWEDQHKYDWACRPGTVSVGGIHCCEVKIKVGD